MRQKLFVLALLFGLAMFAAIFVRLMIAEDAAHFRLFDAPYWFFLQFLIGVALFNALDRWMVRRGRKQHTVAYYVRLFLLGGVGFIIAGTAMLWVVEYLVHDFVPLTNWYREVQVVAIQLYLYLLFASTYLLARYFQQENEIQLRLQTVEKERAQAKLRAMRQHINPHFLFNNLNVLSALIEPANEPAHQYLAHLSALYRHLLKHHDQEVIPLRDELAFANDMVYLLRIRFGAAYDFQEHILSQESLTEGLIPPGILQELLHNAVKHNDASPARPLTITLTVSQNLVAVRNDLRPGADASGTGFGLANLRERVRVITDTPVEVERTAAAFTVRVPITRLLPLVR
ncbi:sensor histidine kinase [Hymenobacter terrenus]|uniref:sensor histidine kinase n=1 Tax=Hymenobacter terrenus TaxID=1629124 RepID=UPI0006196EB9|nr:histidine kinase [Hymenobacter terrenus]